MTAASNTSEIAAARERLDTVRREVARVFVGSLRPVDTMMMAVLARGHVLLEGVPGVAKTTLAIYSQAYQLYVLSCLRAAHRMFDLDPSSEILIVFISLE